MTGLEKLIGSLSQSSYRLLDHSIALEAYTPIDLSVTNAEIKDLDISKPDTCQAYIDKVLKDQSAMVAYGGYREKRNLYEAYEGFKKEGKDPRNIHLGMDFWAKAGTSVVTPLRGRVHSFKNNDRKGDYGPTIILEHNSFHRRFYTLYGHLSLSSIRQLRPGKVFETGEVLG
ncbi:MAG: peptidoglycan DD-metalloendopeptidase family protein, partial [Eudoraea sp.]|nr:peptidoglycan DD-metalloendopeptidase family protein [Eudoraea sp.]